MNDIGLKDFFGGGLIYSIDENLFSNATVVTTNNEGQKQGMSLFLLNGSMYLEQSY